MGRAEVFGELMELKPGDKAPTFALATDGDGRVSLSSLKGRPFVLYFYPKDDTPGCTKEAIGFSESRKKFEALGVSIIGVSKDSAASHDKFKAKHKLNLRSPPTRKLRSPRPTGSGAKRHFTEGNTWDGARDLLLSTAKELSGKSGARLRSRGMWRSCLPRQKPFERPEFWQTTSGRPVNATLLFLG